MTLLIRHAQSEWNLHFGAWRIDVGLPDPGLTDEGRQQADEAASRLVTSGIARIVTSPYRRTLETAGILAERLGVPITVDPMVRERCAFSCDQGSGPADLEAGWGHLDLSRLGPVWWGGTIESVASLDQRCARFRADLATLDDRDRLAVVTHWGFIRGLTGQEVGNCGVVRLDAVQ